jgi:hypothetical protein
VIWPAAVASLIEMSFAGIHDERRRERSATSRPMDECQPGIRSGTRWCRRRARRTTDRQQAPLVVDPHRQAERQRRKSSPAPRQAPSGGFLIRHGVSHPEAADLERLDPADFEPRSPTPPTPAVCIEAMGTTHAGGRLGEITARSARCRRNSCR